MTDHSSLNRSYRYGMNDDIRLKFHHRVANRFNGRDIHWHNLTTGELLGRIVLLLVGAGEYHAVVGTAGQAQTFAQKACLTSDENRL